MQVKITVGKRYRIRSRTSGEHVGIYLGMIGGHVAMEKNNCVMTYIGPENIESAKEIEDPKQE